MKIGTQENILLTGHKHRSGVHGLAMVVTLILLVLTTSSAIAACPSGYKHKETIKSSEVQMRFKGRGEFNTCLNQNHPNLNNNRGSYGLNYGKATYKCGDITVRSYLGNPQKLLVKSSAGFVNFNRYGFGRDGGRRNLCKGNVCLEASSQISNWAYKDHRIELKYINKIIFNQCTKVTF
jgi:hypothetical protein